MWALLFFLHFSCFNEFSEQHISLETDYSRLDGRACLAFGKTAETSRGVHSLSQCGRYSGYKSNQKGNLFLFVMSLYIQMQLLSSYRATRTCRRWRDITRKRAFKYHGDRVEIHEFHLSIFLQKNHLFCFRKRMCKQFQQNWL